MRLIKKVNPIKVKQSYILSDVFNFKRENISDLSEYVPTLDIERDNFSEEYEKIKKNVLSLEEGVLDKIIRNEFSPRLDAYNQVEWYLGDANIDEIGVWRGTGGLPESWTKGSLKETVNMIINKTDTFKKNTDVLSGSKRVMRAVPYILRFKDLIQNEEFFLPIILPGGMMGREGLKLMKGDINDGCMRSIAYVLSGDVTIKAYIGKI